MMTAEELRDITAMLEGLNDTETSSERYVFGGKLSIVAPGDRDKVVGEVFTSDDGFKFRTL